MQHHIPCRRSGGMGYHNISHAPCHTAYDITSYYMLRARLALVFVLLLLLLLLNYLGYHLNYLGHRLNYAGSPLNHLGP